MTLADELISRLELPGQEVLNALGNEGMPSQRAAM
jgi:hypothetical protein